MPDTRPTPAEVIKAWFDNGAPSAFNAEMAGAILAALAKEGYAIEDSTEYIFSHLGQGMTTDEIRAWLDEARGWANP